MAQPHYFQRNAETCLASAQSATDETERTLWLMRAERWLRLAREASSKGRDEPLTPYLVAEIEQSKGATVEALAAASDDEKPARKANAKVA